MNKCIAVNGVHLSSVNSSGLHRHTETVLTALEADQVPFIVFTGNPEIEALYPDRVHRVAQGLGVPSTKANLQRLLWYQFNLRSRIRNDNVSLFYSPLHEGMLFPTVKQIITIHDLLPLRFPEQNKRFHWYFRFILPKMIRASCAILVDSEATLHDIEHYYGKIDTPSHIVHLGYRDDIFRPSSAIEVDRVKQVNNLENYILTVGELRPYKNIRRLIEAFTLPQLSNLQLAIAGKVHHLDPDIVHYPKKLGIQHKIKFLGVKTPSELAPLYSGAAVFAFPSLCEGFGIPLAEAMACGCPVVASNASCIPEVCGNAAHYFDPLVPDQIGRALFEVATQPQWAQQLRENGFERAKRYTSAKTTNQILEVCKAYL